MALSNAERQRAYRKRTKGLLTRIDCRLRHETAIKLDYLAKHWSVNRTEALRRMLLDTWEREGCPVPGHSEGDVSDCNR